METFKATRSPMMRAGYVSRQGHSPAGVRPAYCWRVHSPAYHLPYSATLAALTEAQESGYLVEVGGNISHTYLTSAPLTLGLFTGNPQILYPSRIAGITEGVPAIGGANRHPADSPAHSQQDAPLAPYPPNAILKMSKEDEEAGWTLLMMSRGVKPGYASRCMQARPVEKAPRYEGGDISYAQVYRSLSRNRAFGVTGQSHDKAWKSLLDQEARGHN
ncbi:hypothetical protein KEM54_006708 [Ascosphaera aggregata]|nr:hypothetical protein KEM54_006708 [Ascosphaera aggregata]